MTCLRVPVSLNTGLIIQVDGHRYVCNLRTTSFCLQVAIVLLCNKYYLCEEGMDHKIGRKFHTHGADEKKHAKHWSVEFKEKESIEKLRRRLKDNIKKAIPLHARTGQEGSRRLRLPDFKTIGT